MILVAMIMMILVCTMSRLHTMAATTTSQSQKFNFILLMQPAAHVRKTRSKAVTQFYSPACSRVFRCRGEFLWKSSVVSSAFPFHWNSIFNSISVAFFIEKGIMRAFLNKKNSSARSIKCSKNQPYLRLTSVQIRDHEVLVFIMYSTKEYLNIFKHFK